MNRATSALPIPWPRLDSATSTQSIEAAQVDDDLLLGAAIPTTAARPAARIVLAGSPGAAEGAFPAYVEAGEQGSEHVETFHWKLDDATWIEQDVIASARELLAPASFAREYLGRFADVGAEERVIEREWMAEAQRRELEPGRLLYAIDDGDSGRNAGPWPEPDNVVVVDETLDSTTRRCPACGEPAVPILYGLPGDRSTFEAAERGEVELGGCIVTDADPDMACGSCGHRWRDEF